LKEAQAAGIVTLTGKDNIPKVSLHPSLAAKTQPTRPVQSTQSTKTTSSSVHIPTPTPSIQPKQKAQSHAKFAPLLDVLRTAAVPAGTMVDNTVIGGALKKKKFSYKDVGYSKLVTYVEAAEAEGLVTVQRRSSTIYVGLLRTQ